MPVGPVRTDVEGRASQPVTVPANFSLRLSIAKRQISRACGTHRNAPRLLLRDKRPLFHSGLFKVSGFETACLD